MTNNHVLVKKLVLVLGLLFISPMLLALEQFTDTFSETVLCENRDGYSETIYLEGTYRVQMQYIEAGDHVTSFFNIYWKANGLGLDNNAEYVMRGKWMEVIQENPPYIFIWNDHFQLIGKGQAENFNTYFKVKIVINANGDPIIEFIDANECESVSD
ncbi:MAG: hypothetical protein OEU84_10845 [Xanthomonadales bacterium]|jgi:hypothetical protein|nr:hypothetical protein [Xanthomonadales bacterium]